jgi:hypothetical protein
MGGKPLSICIRKAAEYKIMVNAHEAVRPRNKQNISQLNRERISERNGYQSFGGSKPNHVTLLPFD